LAKDKISEENRALMEQSVDIDQHLKNFKKDMLTNQLENQKYELEEALRKKMKEARSKMNKDLAE